MFRNELYISNTEDVAIPAHLNFGKYILDSIKKQPKDNVALINGRDGTKVTYGEFSQYAVDLAVSLTKLGVGRGDIVAVCSEYRNEYLPIALGIVLTGATYTPQNLGIGRDNLNHNLNLSKPKHLFFSKLFWETYGDVLKAIKFEKYFKIDEMEFGNMAIFIKELTLKNYNVQEFVPTNVNGQIDVAHIIYTSGSTGFSKAIMTTHLSCILNCLIKGLHDPAIKVAICLGYWSHGYNNQMTFKFLAAGRTVVFYNGDMSMFLKCIDTYQVNIAFIKPSVAYEMADLMALQEFSLDSLQYIYSGASMIDDDLRNEIIKRLPQLKMFINGYGMSETFELASHCWAEPGHKLDSLGKPSLGITLKIVDLQTGETLGPNKRGEICVDAHNKFKGYIGIDPSTYLDKEGFLKTGDLGYYDEDGYIYYIDRIKELISNGGFKMSPLEMERILRKYPGVKDAGVVGIPDPKFGECPVAFIVTEPGSIILEKDVMDFFHLEAPDLMQLRAGVKFIDKIPRNYMGKIMRSDLRKMIDF